jgi:hypothetical protein
MEAGILSVPRPWQAQVGVDSDGWPTVDTPIKHTLTRATMAKVRADERRIFAR